MPTTSARLSRCADDVERLALSVDDPTVSSQLRSTAVELRKLEKDVTATKRRVMRLVTRGLQTLPARREKSFCGVVSDPKVRAIHPNSTFKRRWDFLTSVFSVVQVFGPEFRLFAGAAVSRYRGIGMIVGEAALDISDRVTPTLLAFLNFWFLVDLALNFCTGYVDSRGVLIMSKRRITVHYLTTFFALDLWCALPDRAAKPLSAVAQYYPSHQMYAGESGGGLRPISATSSTSTLTCNETTFSYCPPRRRGPVHAAIGIWRRARVIVPKTLALARRRGRLRQVLVSAPSLTAAVVRLAKLIRRSAVLRLKWKNAAVLVRRTLRFFTTRTQRLTAKPGRRTHSDTDKSNSKLQHNNSNKVVLRRRPSAAALKRQADSTATREGDDDEPAEETVSDLGEAPPPPTVAAIG